MAWPELIALFAAIWSNAVSLLSGILGIVFTVWCLAYPQTPARPAFLVAAIASLLLSPVFAWRDEHRKVVALEARLAAPAMVGQFTHLTTAPVGQDGEDTFVTIGGNIQNPSGPATALIDWSMAIEWDDGRVASAEYPTRSDKDIKLGVGSNPTPQYLLPSGSYWPVVTQTPIPAGGVAVGWLWGWFRGIKEGDIRNGHATLVLSCVDVASGHKHSIRQKIGVSPMNIKPFGLGDIPRPINH